MTGAVKITPLEGLVINADYTYNIYSKNASEVQRTFTDYTAVAGTEALYVGQSQVMQIILQMKITTMHSMHLQNILNHF